jgi:hypothetical protein
MIKIIKSDDILEAEKLLQKLKGLSTIEQEDLIEKYLNKQNKKISIKRNKSWEKFSRDWRPQ